MRNRFSKIKGGSALILATVLLFPNNPAFASRNGVEVKENSFTVGITFKSKGIDEICSGVLLSPTIILTAAHCIINTSGTKNTDFIFTAPGTPLDGPINPATMPQIVTTFVPEKYLNTSINETDDIAFVQLDRPIAKSGYIKVATEDDVLNIKNGQKVSGYGYGSIFETGSPYSIYPRKYSMNWIKHEDPTITRTDQVYSPDSTSCTGDSGGPITLVNKDGNELLIGIMSGASNVKNRCGTPGADGNFSMQVTVAYFYLPLVKDVLEKSLATPSASPSPSPSPKPTVIVKKVYKITCVKGKVKKYLTGTGPKCPSGYKQTAKVLISK